MAIYKAKQFSVDSEGAYLVSLTDGEGEPILFERTAIDGKRRGGSHVCLPYFGVDAAGALPQHGFGRDVSWDVRVVDENTIDCSYIHAEHDDFEGLGANLRYQLGEEGGEFTTTLHVMNQGEKSMTVTPGFHPYFAVDTSDVRLNGTAIDVADFEPYKDYPDTNEMMLETAGRTIKIASGTLRHMVAWTNLQGDFLCVEPTKGGHNFDSEKQDRHSLPPGEKLTLQYTIGWA